MENYGVSYLTTRKLFIIFYKVRISKSVIVLCCIISIQMNQLRKKVNSTLILVFRTFEFCYRYGRRNSRRSNVSDCVDFRRFQTVVNRRKTGIGKKSISLKLLCSPVDCFFLDNSIAIVAICT
jgi:hypothetical protein